MIRHVLRFAAGFAIAAAAVPVHAQGAAGAEVTGVAGERWGTPLDSIVARRGRPVFRQADAEGLQTIGYTEQLLGRETIVVFYVHPRSGLVRGGYTAEAATVPLCQMVVRAWDANLARRYPGMRTEVRSIGQAGGEPCAAWRSGAGGWMKVWHDPANGARIMLALLPGAPGVMLTYTTPQADAWERRKNQSRF